MRPPIVGSTSGRRSPLQRGEPPASRRVQERLEALALLGGRGLREHPVAAGVGVLARSTD